MVRDGEQMRLFLKGGYHLLEVVDNVNVLGALCLALAALDTLAGLAVVLGQQVVVEFGVAALLLGAEVLQRVVQVEVLGNGNLLRTAVSSG